MAQGTTLTSSPPAPLTSSTTAAAVQASGVSTTRSSVTAPSSGIDLQRQDVHLGVAAVLRKPCEGARARRRAWCVPGRTCPESCGAVLLAGCRHVSRRSTTAHAWKTGRMDAQARHRCRRRSPPCPGRSSCPRGSAAGRRTTARSRSATARPTPSRARSRRCSGCSSVRPGQRVLDVGAGSGWTTALLAHLSGRPAWSSASSWCPSSPPGARRTSRRTSGPWASVREALPGVLGVPELAPYDRILVSAEPGRMPPELLDQLADPGRMVLPVGGRDDRGRPARAARTRSPSTGTTGSSRCVSRRPSGLGAAAGSAGARPGSQPGGPNR